MEKYFQISDQQLQEIVNTIDELHRLPQKENGFEQLPPVAERLENLVWRLQVAPISPLGKLFEPSTRDLSLQQGKQVAWRWTGPEIEIDPDVHQILSQCLIHAIRNAIDHGIETPAERTIAGKPAAGQIEINVSLRCGYLSLRVSDDGSGPNVSLVVQKAVQSGLMAPNHANRLTFSEKMELLFAPGFSTKKTATETSGRGMGLDAIRNSLRKIGGDAFIEPTRGEGFRLNLLMPVQKVGMEAVPFKIGGVTFWIPEDDVTPLDRRKLNAENSAQSLAMVRAFGKDLATDIEYPFLKIKRDAKTDFLLAVEEVGMPAQRFFRKVDPSWKNTGPEWLKAWWEACRGQMLACRENDKASTLPMGILTDGATLWRFMTHNQSATA